jgi:hypothetical protein
MNRLRRALLCAGLFSMVLPVWTGLAQDTHYWNLSYGTRSTLLGGAVIGSVSDLSATYYNPGALGTTPAGGLVLSAGVYEANSYTLGGADSLDTRVNSFRVNPAPSYLAGRLPSDSLIGEKLTYSLITRQSMKLDLQTRSVTTDGRFLGIPVQGDLVSENVFLQDITEVWAGITWSRALSKTVGVGVTTYGALRSQTRRVSLDAQQLTPSAEVRGLSAVINYNYYNVRLLWKAGLIADLSPVSFGLTVTTPSVNLFGSGSAFVNSWATGVDLDGDSVADNYLLANYQEGLASRYNSSWAVGAGLAYRTGRWRFDFSAEWYAPVRRFAVLETQAFTAQSTGQTVNNDLTHELDPVLNFGLGMEYQAGEATTVFLSAVTDFSGAVPGTSTNLSMTTLDLYHITAGGLFNLGDIDLTFGAGYAFGSNPITEAAAQSSSEVLRALAERVQDIEFISRKFKLIFAFSYRV